MTEASLAAPLLAGSGFAVLTMAKSVEHWTKHVKNNIRSGMYEPGDFILDLRPGRLFQGWQYGGFLPCAAQDGFLAVGDYEAGKADEYPWIAKVAQENGLGLPVPELMDTAMVNPKIYVTLDRDRNTSYWEKDGESVIWTASKTREQTSEAQRQHSRANARFALML